MLQSISAPKPPPAQPVLKMKRAPAPMVQSQPEKRFPPNLRYTPPKRVCEEKEEDADTERPVVSGFTSAKNQYIIDQQKKHGKNYNPSQDPYWFLSLFTLAICEANRSGEGGVSLLRMHQRKVQSTQWRRAYSAVRAKTRRRAARAAAVWRRWAFRWTTCPRSCARWRRSTS